MEYQEKTRYFKTIILNTKQKLDDDLKNKNVIN